MGLQKCSGCLNCLLIPLALWSIVINILLYFPDGKSSYASSNNHTIYVWHFEGICFSGIMILILAALLVILDRDTFYECFQSESCTRTYRRFISVVLSLLGIAFSGYSLIISALSLVQGPYCKTSAGWEYAFKNTAGSYLMDPTSWSQCTEPSYVVEWNIILLSILIVLSGLQILICFLKIIAELRQILCGNYPIFVQPFYLWLNCNISGITGRAPFAFVVRSSAEFTQPIISLLVIAGIFTSWKKSIDTA